MEALQTISYACPHCWETIETEVAPTELPAEFIEDCSVCCHPILLRVNLTPDGHPELTAESAA
jgi:hypothetical protein